MRKSFGQIIRRYAAALYESALEANAVPEVAQQAKTASAVLDADAIRFFTSPLQADQSKKDTLESFIASIKAHPVLAGIMRVMLENERFLVLKDVLRTFMKMADEFEGIVRADVFAARPLSSVELGEFESALTSAMKKKVILESKIDESLKAGYVIKIGNTIVDASLRSRLVGLKESLSQGV